LEPGARRDARAASPRGWSFNLPLGVAMLFAAIAGVLVAALFGSIRVIRLSRRVRRLEKERAASKSALS
jgi:uncharacterized integral membrane protein